MSSKISVVPFKPEHLQMIEVRAAQGECPKTVLTTAATFFRGEEVIAIVGGFPFIPGVIHFWAMISDKVRKCPIDFHKTCLEYLRWYEVNEKPRRLQLEVLCDYRMGCRWAEALGFVKEGIMKKWWIDGRDAYLYGRTV